MIAKRASPGKTSRKISSRLAARSAARFDRPVTFAPGRASEATIPVPTGSPATGKTIGMTEVARLPCRKGRLGSDCVNEIDLEPDELGRYLGKAIGASLRPAIVDGNGATLNPTEFVQATHKCVGPGALTYLRAGAQKSDGRQLRLLRACRERPRSRRAAERR